jgi:hypothetical protein
MQHSDYTRRPHSRILSKTGLAILALLIVALVLLTVLLVPGARTLYASGLHDLFGAVQRAPLPVTGNSTNRGISSSELTFEQGARRLAEIGSPAAYEELVLSLRQNEPPPHRSFVVSLLENAPPQVVPVLMQSLGNSDEGVRSGSIQVLGVRHEYQAIDALALATRDSSFQVRLEAVTALGVLNARQTLPRLDVLEISEANADVRAAATSSKALIENGIASEMHLSNFQLVASAATTSSPPRFYQATKDELYTFRNAVWERVSALPDTPIVLATGREPDVLFLSTASSGLFKSSDGGVRWEYVQFGLSTPTSITVTAMAVDPENPDRVYAALAAPGAISGQLDPLGIFEELGSDAWKRLENSPVQAVTTRLAIDSEAARYLFGETGAVTWRYDLDNSALTLPLH